MLENWINLHYLNNKTIIYFQSQFKKNKPFPHLELTNFFIEEKVIDLLKALQKEQFFLKEADLFTFLQTNDFKRTKNKTLQNFRKFLSSKQFVNYISKLTNMKLGKFIDIFGTVYGDTHYLLPHDDRLENRKIAYFLYLSNLEKKDGGKLLLHNSDKVIKNILPRFNTFAFFQVSKKSLHSVEEVIDNQRVTITGWFHG